MATNISSDISSNVNITARKNDSFYLKATITNSDGSVFDMTGYTSASLQIENANGVVVKKLARGGTPSTETDEVSKPDTIAIDTDLGIVIINVPAITSSTSSGSSVNYTNINLLVGTYDYTLKLTSTTQVHTIMHGKFKSVN